GSLDALIREIRKLLNGLLDGITADNLPTGDLTGQLGGLTGQLGGVTGGLPVSGLRVAGGDDGSLDALIREIRKLL
ncbi:hypothetical protein, partial [Rhizohabitans arisaemae]|uniref:hypothetical protein n=1 Tax=Rhizohabitans arisaemae TaxID=2720610 RepID=UPI0024B1F568